MIRILILNCCLFLICAGSAAQYQASPKQLSIIDKMDKAEERKRSKAIEKGLRAAIRLNEQSNVLNFLNNSDPLNFIVDDTPEWGRSTAKYVREAFPGLRKAFSRNIFFITDEIYKRYLDQKYDLHQVTKGERLAGSGTFIRKFKGEGTTTIFYDIDAVVVDSMWQMQGTVAFFNFHERSKFPQLTFFVRMMAGKREYYLQPSDVKQGLTDSDLLVDVFHFLYFIKSKKLNTTLIPTGTLVKYQKQFYLNESAYDIGLLGL